MTDGFLERSHFTVRLAGSQTRLPMWQGYRSIYIGVDERRDAEAQRRSQIYSSLCLCVSAFIPNFC